MSQKFLLLLGFITLKLVLQFLLLDPVYELHRDEFLHLDQGGHPAWGFLSVPPVTSWISWLLNLAGRPVWLVRLVPIGFGVCTMLVIWKTVEVLNGGRFAALLALTGFTLSVMLRLNQLYQPNSLDVLCWTLWMYCLLRHLDSGHVKWLYAAALVFALGFLNKYNIGFAVAGTGIGLLISRHRAIFTRKHTWLAALLATVLISPNLFWQYQNHFPVVHHMDELARTQLLKVNRGDFLTEQVLFFAGTLCVIVAGVVGLLRYRPFRRFRFLAYVFVAVLVLFVLLKAKGYYAIGLYPIYIAIGAVYLEKLLVGKRLHAGVKVALLVFPLIIFIVLTQAVFPNKSPQQIAANNEAYRKIGMLRWEDGKDHQLPQDFADMLGWSELARKTDSAWVIIGQPGSTLVLCDNYGQAGAINYYSKKGIKAVSFNADYLNWFDLSKEYKHLIRVKNAWEKKEEMLETAPLFQTAYLLDTLANPYAREVGTGIFVFQDAKIKINSRIEAEVNEKKKEWE